MNWIITRGAQGDAFSIEGPSYTVAHIKHHKDAEAHAQLIAAAPDLLEAANAYLDSQSVVNLYCLKAAIAKAEGTL